MIDINKLIETVAVFLQDTQPPTEQALRTLVQRQAEYLAAFHGVQEKDRLSESDLDKVVKTIETRFSIRMPLGSMFIGKEYEPWLANRQGDIKWFFWERYRRLLIRNAFPPYVVSSLDKETDKILDHLGDPKKKGKWSRKGLVVGHVQSGKTANYTGVICKGADAGYRVIIVLAGTLNSLRNQTQERIDEDFLGWCTRTRRPIGDNDFGKRKPVYFTTSIEDFKKQTANALGMSLGALNEPVIVIIKKNTTTLENLTEWLKDNNRHDLKNFPMMLIDDEADYASINTKKENQTPAATNMAIRNLLSLFSRTSFVGYTATPFANIFIDPDTDKEMESGEFYKDLFPRDFILSLNPPDNYVGPNRLFTENADLDCIRNINDNNVFLPITHKIEFDPQELPVSLKKAMCCFIIGKAIRILRGQVGQCHSMMVNASRFTKVQNKLSGLILDYLKQLKNNISGYGALPSVLALENKDLSFIKNVFDEEFLSAGFDWTDVQKALKDSADPIEILTINVGSTDTLDFKRQTYPKGRSIIAVGGMGLSRGLTLNGLMTSYFLRSTIMYDTLMQMGRWFGYRDGYADLCRIYMTKSASSWYKHISEATEELRRDFKAMEKARLSPIDFGLRVRTHPAALIVTARNKMRTGRKVPIRIALEGRLAETSVVFADDVSVKHNRKILESLVTFCDKEVKVVDTNEPDQYLKLGYLWKGVPPRLITSAITEFSNHPACLLTYPEPLIQHIEWICTGKHNKFDVLLRSQTEVSREEPFGSYTISPPSRTAESWENNTVVFNRRRIGSIGDERAGLSKDEIEQVKNNYNGKNVPDREYRKVANRNPLFIIYLINVKKTKDDEESILVPAFAVSFPGDPGSAKKPAKLVEYVVNTTWWKQNYGDPEEEQEEEEL